MDNHLAVVEKRTVSCTVVCIPQKEGCWMKSIEMDLDQIGKVMVSEIRYTVISASIDLRYHEYTVVMYDVKDDAFQKLDRMVMETQTNTSMYGSYGLYISLHYDRSKQILYSIQMNDDNGLYVSAQTNKRFCITAFCGDYNDDTYLKCRMRHRVIHMKISFSLF